ncbi:MAG: hypothetical protein WC735_00010 [Candidatus Paceibacterota bacterium]|jgi:hypothetical protein
MDTSINQNPILGDSILGSKWLNPDYLFNQGVSFFSNLNFDIENGTKILSVFHTFLFLFAIFFLTIISYCIVRMFEIRKKEHKYLKHELAEYAHHQAEHERKLQEKEGVSKNERWVKTLHYLFSQHSGDWKLAIIEADAMLESLMGQLGFKGETFGDKLKSADQEKFRNLTSAWEVHTIRNRIAHEGASFELSQREAKRIISIYEQIFREFGFI